MAQTDLPPIDLSLPGWRDDPGALKAELVARQAGRTVILADLARPADTLTIQLLLAARRAADAAGAGFELRNVSDPFRKGLQTLGLHNEILG